MPGTVRSNLGDPEGQLVEVVEIVETRPPPMITVLLLSSN